jgi:hypothetical protein
MVLKICCIQQFYILLSSSRKLIFEKAKNLELKKI